MKSISNNSNSNRKRIAKLTMLVTAATISLGTSQAVAATPFMFTITNGSPMPISPGVLVSIDEKETYDLIGARATPGLVTLCKSGNPDVLIEELKIKAGVRSVQKLTTPTLPGASSSLMIKVSNLEKENLRFLAMYGKTKDACSWIDVSSADLIHAVRLNHGIRGGDQILTTGAFSEPALPEFFSSYCDDAMDAASCLRMLSMEVSGGTVHFFQGYLPSVVQYLETKYGSTDTQTLSLNSGSVRFDLKKGD